MLLYYCTFPKVFRNENKKEKEGGERYKRVCGKYNSRVAIWQENAMTMMV